MLELIIAVIVLAVIVALTQLKLSAFLQRQRIATSSQTISNTFSLTRSEALTRLPNIDVYWVRLANGVNAVHGFNVPPGQMMVLTTINPAVEIATFEYDTGNLAISDGEGANPCVTYTTQANSTGLRIGRATCFSSLPFRWRWN